MTAHQTSPCEPQVTAQQANQQVAILLSETINHLCRNQSSKSKRQPPNMPLRPQLTMMGEAGKTIMADTAATILTAAKTMVTAGTIVIAPTQIETLKQAGVEQQDLAVVANLSGMTFSHRVRELHDRMQTISSIPVSDPGTAADWMSWTFTNRQSYLYVRPTDMSTEPLGKILDRVCEKIADQVWANLPDAQYVANRLAVQSTPVKATKFSITLKQCYQLAEHIDPHLRHALPMWPGHEDEPQAPEILFSDARPYTHPITPSAIRHALKTSLGQDDKFVTDLGELKEIDNLRRYLNEIQAAYVNHHGDVWYSKEDSSQQLLHDLPSSNTPENRSNWPNGKHGLNPNVTFTTEEIQLANLAAPQPPFQTPETSHYQPTTSPITAAAWLNRITFQQAAAHLNQTPDPGTPQSQCPSRSECPTSYAYVQRTALLPHTLFPDGKYEHCRFHHFRIMHGSKPAAARRQIADKMAAEVQQESRHRWKTQEHLANENHNAPYAAQTSNKNNNPSVDKPTQKSLL